MDDLPQVIGRVRLTADDFGITEGVDSAVVRLCALNLISATAIFANRLSESTARALEQLGCEISIHLNVTSGKPISAPESVRSLVALNGNFHAPKDYVLDGDQSPLDAVHRYHTHVVPDLNSSELLREFRAQRDYCGSIIGKISRRYSLHHDLDQVLSVRGVLDSVWPEFITRQCELDRGLLSGYGYVFASPNETVEVYTNRLVRFIKGAAAISARSGGVPYEIAVHPAMNSNGLDDFTVYRAGRITEYIALMKIADLGLFSSFDKTLGGWSILLGEDS